MSVEELYNALKSDAKMAEEFENAIDAGKLSDFAKTHGVDASEDEIASYIASKSN